MLKLKNISIKIGNIEHFSFKAITAKKDGEIHYVEITEKDEKFFLTYFADENFYFLYRGETMMKMIPVDEHIEPGSFKIETIIGNGMIEIKDL